MKWSIEMALLTNIAKDVAKSIYKNIMITFGCPMELVSDQGKHFMNEVIQELTHKHMIIHKKSSTYHPQCNGKLESTNKTLVKALKKIMKAKKRIRTESFKDHIRYCGQNPALWEF